jgi:exodeoxyribonuclease-5
VNETLICLQNNQHYGIFNGTFLYVEEVIHEDTVKFEVTATTDDGRKQRYRLWKGGFNNGKTAYHAGGLVVDYGYCVTCHKFQGSEDARITVIDEQANDLWDATRWRYTAFTRAQEHLNVYIG